MNLIIIGAGPAGEAAAKTARRLSSTHPEPVNITLIEKEEAGGLCLNKGCIPSKTLLEEVRKRSAAGLPVNWADIQPFKTHVVTTIRSQLEASLKALKIDLVRGTARFNWPSSIEVTSSNGTKTIPFDKAIIATGTSSFYPPPLDQFRAAFWDSDRILNVERTPKSLVVIGGGAVGCEFACLMNAAGAKVTIVELKETLLPGEDAAVAGALQRSFEERGIAVKTDSRVVAVEKNGHDWRLALSQGDIIEAEQALVCVGRSAQFAELNLDAGSIRVERNALALNERLQTTNPNVFAAGDAASTRLAHAAAEQGAIAAANALGDHQTYDDRFVPRCLYSWPEVASVGQWKYQLEDAGKPVKTGRAFFKGAAKALAAKETEGFVQIVSDPGGGKILGAQIIGPHATELIHVFSVALKANMTLGDLAGVMFAHPTLGEVIRDAARK